VEGILWYSSLYRGKKGLRAFSGHSKELTETERVYEKKASKCRDRSVVVDQPLACRTTVGELGTGSPETGGEECAHKERA